MTASGDHVVGSILFTDLVGFTEFTDELGDRAALAVLDRQRTIVDDALGAEDRVRVVKELGDGLMIWFDGDADAIGAAGRLRAAFERARADEFPLAVRMGLHTGVAIRRGDDLVGRTVNVAARVCDLAGPGELLASDAAVTSSPRTAPAVVEPIGPARVRGVEEPVWLHRIA